MLWLGRWFRTVLQGFPFRGFRGGSILGGRVPVGFARSIRFGGKRSAGGGEGFPDVDKGGGGGAESLREGVLVGGELALHVEDILEVGQAVAVEGVGKVGGLLGGGDGSAQVVEDGVGGAVRGEGGFAFGGGG